MKSDAAPPLVFELIDAVSRAHTITSLAESLRDAFGRHVGLRWLELGRTDQRDAEIVRARAAPPSIERVETSPFSALARDHGSRFVDLEDHPVLPEGARALLKRAQASWLAVWPLTDARGTVGYLALAGGAPHSPPLDAPWQELVARLLCASLRQAVVLGRVAALSRRAYADNAELREVAARADPSDVVSASPAMRLILHEVVPIVARATTTVLLRGESGTGKEVVARRLHALSSRAHRPFLKVNCGALPETIVESALFGHERGAFTGATRRAAGYFERAHGGTLLLDEVAELSPSCQVKLLRVLQEGELERVGGERTIRVDVRVIAATHRNLEAMLEEEKFRHDLYYRLNVFPIVLPPLRERPEDVEALTLSILNRLARRLGRSVPRVTPMTLAELVAHPWPGNVRELENVLERAVLMNRGETLHLPSPVGAPADQRFEGRGRKQHEVLSFREASKRAIERALSACQGRIYGPDGAAAALGLRPTTLQSKMVRLGMGSRSGRSRVGRQAAP